MISAEELSAILKVCVDNRVTRLRSGDLVINIQPASRHEEPRKRRQLVAGVGSGEDY